ncbi:bifunctional (p)ppGpp synthetase/guanosine-3',5'-bis(diphosphate) 3'-pyrophosphohydrolase [Brotonthovivens ammoniilytica]|uniref:GTP diphosphokinase n=2 Tax=Brotonthovivens ammoniilytica TaxID=2981725 RepID=A0ABT2TI39_9FIRM|nr:bifunctional (p)ppGpp synthetase/guanosine-3',5'-bis(diphosphate) 3'-pyrophosphohydrolase [Brotonthovivens ammoniilytica]MCU6761872.1 bifunctional (p)ppGpp synthetase/guanosine-3',5'-bis(diphosphate) 3'-pyrophosphohydrolase [Brotonthovivens ammoniilytica]
MIPTKDFIEPSILYEELLKRIRKYHPSEDVSLVEKAYRVAESAHTGQVRKSGEPYIIHPLYVAIILAELEMDKETIVAGILHDVVEDTVMTDDEIKAEFGEEVELLVDGVTKLGQLSYDGDKIEVQAENLRKMFLAMAKDIRVIIIKLADRLHNMRTLKYMKPEKQKEKARETMDIYAPIAQRLGISKIKIELEDLSLKYLEPEAYYDLVEKVAQRKSVRDEYVQSLVDEVGKYIDEAGIKASIVGRAKHFFSIYKKMVNQGKTLDQIYDLFAIRIIVKDVKNCYAALGVIHEKYKPIPGRFKDYIAMPKPNMYQSLHTTLIGPNGQPFEIQIRTEEMHRTSEYGIAAHWKYKEASNGGGISGEEAKLSWLRQILEWQQDLSDNKEFMSLLKSDLDLFSDAVFCFTPTGDVKNLPRGSTPIDFAYNIHTAVGNKMIGAKVNGKLVPIDYKIRNGDRIEVLTSQNSRGPSHDWLNIVKSTQAKNKINQWFRNEFKEENIQKGKELLHNYCKVKGVQLSDINKPEYQVKVQRKYGFRDWNSVLASVGHGGLKEAQIINRMMEEYRREHAKKLTDEQILALAEGEKEKAAVKPKERSKSGIIVKGLTDVAVHFSKCCGPVPGDEIVGFVTRGRGVSVHRTDCINIIQLPESERVRLIDAEWQQGAAEEAMGGRYLAEIKIFCNNRTGLLVDISRIFMEREIDIDSINSRTSKKGVATISVQFHTKGKDEMNSLMDKIRMIDSVFDIKRTTG